MIVQNDKIYFKESIIYRDVFRPRRVIQPGEKLQYRITFDPKLVGGYKNTFTIEITNFKALYKISCEGLCDIPMIDSNPDFMFIKTISARNEKNSHKNCVYVKSSETFDFGYIFLQRNKGERYNEAY